MLKPHEPIPSLKENVRVRLVIETQGVDAAALGRVAIFVSPRLMNTMCW